MFRQSNTDKLTKQLENFESYAKSAFPDWEKYYQERPDTIETGMRLVQNGANPNVNSSPSLLYLVVLEAVLKPKETEKYLSYFQKLVKEYKADVNIKNKINVGVNVSALETVLLNSDYNKKVAFALLDAGASTDFMNKSTPFSKKVLAEYQEHKESSSLKPSKSP